MSFLKNIFKTENKNEELLEGTWISCSIYLDF